MAASSARTVLTLMFALSVLGACSSTDAIDSAGECAESFKAAFDRPGALPTPADDEIAVVSYQDADDWEGRTPVCWVAYSSNHGCHGFMLDLTGTWAPAEWVDTGIDPQPCPPDGINQKFAIGA